MDSIFTKMRMGMGALLLLAGTTSSLAEGPISVESAIPADGSTVINLKTVKLNLLNAHPDYGTEWASGVKASVTNADGEQVTTATGRDSGTGFSLQLKDKISTPGTYTINVPANAMYTMDWDTFEPDESTYNEAFTLTYNVVDMEPAVIGETTPPSGSAMKRLKQLPIEVTGGDELYGLEWRSGVRATISNQDGEQLETYATIRNINGYRLNLNEEITTPGTYSINIPSNALYAIDEEFQEVYGTGNSMTILHYIVVDSPAMAFASAEPSTESAVETLENVTVFWTGGDETVGYEINPEVESTVSNSDGEIVSYCTVEQLEETATGYLFMLDTPVTENGTYTLTIPAKAFYAKDAEGNRVYDNYSPALSLTYEVSGEVGVAAVEAADNEKEVYNLQGIRVCNTELPAGMYIINGKKVIVK